MNSVANAKRLTFVRLSVTLAVLFTVAVMTWSRPQGSSTTALIQDPRSTAGQKALIKHIRDSGCTLGMVRASYVPFKNVADDLQLYLPTGLPAGFAFLTGLRSEGGELTFKQRGVVWTDKDCRKISLGLLPDDHPTGTAEEMRAIASGWSLVGSNDTGCAGGAKGHDGCASYAWDTPKGLISLSFSGFTPTEADTLVRKHFLAAPLGRPLKIG